MSGVPEVPMRVGSLLRYTFFALRRVMRIYSITMSLTSSAAMVSSPRMNVLDAAEEMRNTEMARMLMMTIATSNSTSVNARLCRLNLRQSITRLPRSRPCPQPRGR